jgi:hypothetical protein
MAPTKGELIANGYLDKIPDDEPIFILRGKDVTAPNHVRSWASMAEQQGAPPEKVLGARQTADAMDNWPGEKKLPD